MRRAKPVLRRAARVVPPPRSSDTPDPPAGPSHSNLSTIPSASDQQEKSVASLASSSISGSSSSRPAAAETLGPLPPSESIWHPNATTTNPIPLVDERSTGHSEPNPQAIGGILDGSSGSGGGSVQSDSRGPDPSQALSEGSNLFGYQFVASGLPLYASISEIEDDDLGDDPEGVKEEMCNVPTLDPNTTDNALPFVLQSYARWMNLVSFEPSKAIHLLKENIINQFMRSPAKRSRLVLLSNVIGALGKTIDLGPRGLLLVTYLRTEAHQDIDKFILDQPAGSREVDRQNALEALSLMMEVILIQRYSSSIVAVLRLLEAAAPVFRRACPEPMDQYVNLPRAVISPEVNIRHFATTDVICSITTGRSLLFRYDVTYPPNILEQIKDGRYGVQWLHGIADQYIVILARINVLSEELGANVTRQIVTEVEDQIREVDISTERSTDPVSTICRFTVRECWKVTMYVYLYMVLCQASANDPRVVKSVKSFNRLIDAVKPGRHPDAFLYIPLIIMGASAYRKQDRAVIQRRMLGLGECVKPGSCGCDSINILNDLWRRTEAENRPAVWHDLRFSTLRVAGV